MDVIVAGCLQVLTISLREDRFIASLVRQLDNFGVGAMDVFRFGFWLTGTHFHSIFFPGKCEFVSGQKCSADDSLTIDLGTIGAAEITNEKQPIRPDNQAVQLGDAALINTDVAQILLATDKGHVAQDLDWASASKWNELSTHEAPSGEFREFCRVAAFSAWHD